MALRQSSVERSAMASTARTCAGTICSEAPECHCQRGIASAPRRRRPDYGARHLHRPDHKTSGQTHIGIVASRFKWSGASDFRPCRCCQNNLAFDIGCQRPGHRTQYERLGILYRKTAERHNAYLLRKKITTEIRLKNVRE